MKFIHNKQAFKTTFLFTLALYVTQSFGISAEDLTEKLNLTGVLSLENTTSYPTEGQLFFKNSHERIISNNYQQLRLITEGEATKNSNYEFHFTSTNQHQNMDNRSTSSINLYRAKSLKHQTIKESGTSNYNSWAQEIDRANVTINLTDLRFKIGRQPISWGTGRFWQPLDVFGAFAATDIEREYKPGIDLVSADYYPSHLSSLSLIYVFSPRDNSVIKDSQGAIYQTQLGENSSVSIMLSNISSNKVGGGSFETDWLDIGWRIEGTIFEEFDSSKKSAYFIAGIDYQLKNETSISAEYYFNRSGASTSQELEKLTSSTLILSGLQKQLSEQLLGLSLQNTVTPLITLNYTLLTAYLSGFEISTLHQFSGIISLGNESDLRLSLLLTSGEKLDDNKIPQSEFGHIPLGVTLKYKLYF